MNSNENDGDKYAKAENSTEMLEVTNMAAGSEETQLDDNAMLLEAPSNKSTFVPNITCQNQPDGLKMVILGSMIFALAVTIALIIDIYANKHEFGHGGVSCDSTVCSNIGRDLLKKGGSGVDAAIGTLLCLEVMKPESGGIGGGGFMLIHTPRNNEDVIDFRETAPTSASQDMFHKNESIAMKGGMSVAVPGTIRGFQMAHKLHGKLPWKDVFNPAIILARKGIRITSNTVKYLEKYKSSEIAHDFTPNGSIPKAGDIIKRVVLADTFELIAKQGADAFYTGKIAKSIVDKVNSNDGNITLNDLKEYKAIKREAVTTNYNGYIVHSTPPPSSGLVLLSILNILEGFNFQSADSTENLTFHYIIEAFKYAFAQRTFLADPDFVDLTNITTLMTSKSRADWLRRQILSNETFPPEHYGPFFDQEPTPGTMHVSVTGPAGDLVSATVTINTGLGSNLMTDTGFILNNEMDDFAIPGISSFFGVKPSKNNFIKPGKRPLSAISPVVAIDEKDQCNSQIVLGGVGGTRIITATLLSLINMLSFGKNINQAIEAPRCHHQLIPNIVEAEESKFQLAGESSVLSFLRSLHHNVTSYSVGSYVHGVRKLRSTLSAHADNRREGAGASTY